MYNYRKVIVCLVAMMAMFPPGVTQAGSVSGVDLIGMCIPAGIDPVYRMKVS